MSHHARGLCLHNSQPTEIVKLCAVRSTSNSKVVKLRSLLARLMGQYCFARWRLLFGVCRALSVWVCNAAGGRAGRPATGQVCGRSADTARRASKEPINFLIISVPQACVFRLCSYRLYRSKLLLSFSACNESLRHYHQHRFISVFIAARTDHQSYA